MVAGSVEEMNEHGVMKAICSIEQKLLLEDDSPSIHNPDDLKNSAQQKEVHYFCPFHCRINISRPFFLRVLI